MISIGEVLQGKGFIWSSCVASSLHGEKLHFVAISDIYCCIKISLQISAAQNSNHIIFHVSVDWLELAGWFCGSWVHSHISLQLPSLGEALSHVPFILLHGSLGWPERSLLMVMSEVQGGEPHRVSICQDSACVSSANIPLAKASHMGAQSQGVGKCSLPTVRGHCQFTWQRMWIQAGVKIWVH